MKDSQELFGSDLDKRVEEMSMESQARRQHTVFAAEGDFVEIEGDEGIKQKWKNNPEDLDNLLKNGR